MDRCGMAKASDILGDRWSLLILREAFYGVIRFADMQADIGMPRSILTTRLKKLVEAGLLEQFDYREDGARARKGYRLSKRGQELVLVFLAMKQWWDSGQDDAPSVRFVPEGANTAARVALLDESGQEVDPSSLRLQLD
jgi:DNA-binding HxlR family transcriptional regulator